MIRHAPSTRSVALIAVLIVAWGLGAQLIAAGTDLGSDPALIAGDLLVGWTFAATGVVAWRRRPQSRMGVLMIAIAFAWFLRGLYLSTVPMLYTASLLIGSLVNWLLVHAALAFPSGRLERRGDRRLVVAIYVVSLALAVPWAMTADVEELACEHCSAEHNLLLVDPSIDVIEQVTFGLGLVFNLLVIVALVRRWRSAGRPERRVLAPFGLMALAAAVIFLLATIAPSFVYESVPPGGGQWAILAGNFGIGLIPIGFLAGLLRTRVTRSTLGVLMEALARSPGPEELRDHMAAALGDPSLRVGYWAAEPGRYVTEDGAPFVIDGPASYVEGAQGPLAVLVHDRFLLEDEGLIEATTAAARLALENARLQAEVHSRLAEVRESRARIVEAGDVERRRLERDLHDGAQQRLVSLAVALKLVRSDPADPRNIVLLEQAESEARAAVNELRELARGIHPQILTDEGLEGALESLAERTPLRLDLELDLERRPSRAAETAAYYVCAEAVTNAMKHAAASRLRISASQDGDELHLEIDDDGVGGAHVSERGGLRGIADRVEALGGSLQFHSPQGEGTRLRARIPATSR